MSSILLLIISLAAPWVVQLAPPRQRLIALVAVIAVLLLFGIFSFNLCCRLMTHVGEVGSRCKACRFFIVVWCFKRNIWFKCW